MNEQIEELRVQITHVKMDGSRGPQEAVAERHGGQHAMKAAALYRGSRQPPTARRAPALAACAPADSLTVELSPHQAIGSRPSRQTVTVKRGDQHLNGKTRAFRY
ncbi:MAG: hypothetical protein M3Y93_06180, partial [Pseudomonadota bacterium]|nr:hypothetical protein [Pseudomonadota bacterium]